MSYWDQILTDLKASNLTHLEDLFNTCLQLCEKYTKEYALCADKCHGRFNIVKLYTVEAV